MARSINDIQQSILDAKASSTDLNALEVLTTDEKNTLANVDSSSKVAIWRLFVWIIAFAIWQLEKLWDIFKSLIDLLIKNTRVHTRYWYRDKALEFRYGQDLIIETDKYNDTGLTQEQIDTSKIIKHASVSKIVINGYGALKVKLAKETAGEKVKLDSTELSAANYYLNEIADAGTTVLSVSLDHDDLKLEVIVYYDPLVLDVQGRRLDGTNDTPVINEINTHLNSIDFDGEFFPAELEKDIRANVEGVNRRATSIRKSWSKFGGHDYTTIGTVGVGLIDEIRAPESGYLKLDEAELVITYVARSDE
ncbi:MAG: hypothetical protein COB73_00705 [Flavobacteriaceae bacterium]|nr:MAG: hypothetical protein COB73_00705 [Flavobacteriaceae bacterium]